MDNDRIVWRLDEESSDKYKVVLTYGDGDTRLRVSLAGKVTLYTRSFIGYTDFCDLAILHDSMEQAMNLVLGWFPDYEGEIPTG